MHRRPPLYQTKDVESSCRRLLLAAHDTCTNYFKMQWESFGHLANPIFIFDLHMQPQLARDYSRTQRWIEGIGPSQFGSSIISFEIETVDGRPYQAQYLGKGIGVCTSCRISKNGVYHMPTFF